MTVTSLPLAAVGASLLLMSANANDCGGTDPIDVPTPPPGAEDLNMQGADFQCILTGTKVRNFYLWNELGHLNEALAVAASPNGGRYPVGTIIQLIPGEAMVKRFEGFSEVTHDWEYFYLDVTADGAQIVERGSDPLIGPTGVQNQTSNCHDCHVGAEPQWDLICEDGHGCAPLPFTDAMITAVQEADPRCP